MNSIRRKSTTFNSRSFVLDKRSTISTRETLHSPTKSFYIKSKVLNPSKKNTGMDKMAPNVPIDIYFNPEFRNKYVKKVIDSFFTDKKPAKITNPQSRQNSISNSKLCVRSKIKGWRKKANLSSDIQLIDSTRFIRSSPKKSIFSDFSQQQPLSIIDQKNMIQLKQEIKNELGGSLAASSQTISFNNRSGIFRPFSSQNKRGKSRDQQEIKSMNSVTVSMFFNQGNSPQDKLRKQVHRLVESNQYFQEFNVYEEGNIKEIVRKYLDESNPLLLRQEKIFKRGIKTLWNHSKFPSTVQYPALKPIKDQLSQQFYYGSNELDSHIQIYPKTYYNELFFNKNEELVDIIVSMTKFIIKCQGEVLTNAFQLSQKKFHLKNLGSSAITQSIKIRSKNIQCLYPPIFKHENHNNNWLIRPQYLSPELVHSYKNSDYSWIENNPDAVIASEIWSLGCMILQILTLIPLNSDVRCRLKTNSENLRRGFLSIKFTESHVDFDSLQRKQKSLQNILNNKIQKQLQMIPLQKGILQILRKMLVYEPKNRIKPQQILQELKY